MKKLPMKTIGSGLGLALAILALSRCGSDNPVTTTSYQQVERLGRPAINEGLVLTNDYLNAFNSIAPTADLSSAATPVLTEAGTVLTAIYNFATKQTPGLNSWSGTLTPALTADVVAGFLPDVMRIDTSVSTTGVGNWAYNGAFQVVTGVSGTTTPAMLTGGRKIEDDVIDITLSYLLDGAAGITCGPKSGSTGTQLMGCAVADGVFYSGFASKSGNYPTQVVTMANTSCSSYSPAANGANPGHKCLNGQTARNGSATFPFLAPPT